MLTATKQAEPQDKSIVSKIDRMPEPGFNGRDDALGWGLRTRGTMQGRDSEGIRFTSMIRLPDVETVHAPYSS